MGTNLKEFRAEVNQASPLVRRQLVALQFDLTVRFIEIVAPLTPYDTGHAQSNWVASRGSPDPEEREDEPLDIDELVRRAKIALAKLKFGESAFVQNNAPYISFLNDGTSNQAPAGFIDVALGDASSEFQTRISRAEDAGFIGGNNVA